MSGLEAHLNTKYSRLAFMMMLFPSGVLQASKSPCVHSRGLILSPKTHETLNVCQGDISDKFEIGSHLPHLVGSVVSVSDS